MENAAGVGKCQKLSEVQMRSLPLWLALSSPQKSWFFPGIPPDIWDVLMPRSAESRAGSRAGQCRHLLLLSRNSSRENRENSAAAQGETGNGIVPEGQTKLRSLGSQQLLTRRREGWLSDPFKCTLGVAGGAGAALGSAGLCSHKISGNVDLGDLQELQEGGTGFQSKLQLLLHLSEHSGAGINPWSVTSGEFYFWVKSRIYFLGDNWQKFSFPWLWNMTFLTIRDSQTF